MNIIPQFLYPITPIDIKKVNEDKTLFFDAFRKKWIVLKPEEWVRYQLLMYLINQKNYSPSLLSVEKEIRVFNTRKRYDAVYYNTNLLPILLIECKSWDVEINENHLQQIWRYNLKIKAPYLLLTNGVKHFFVKKGKVQEEIPSAEELN